ncbi:hypothetical protein DFS33DRAFT_1261892, partial [Desarmillaria ectypa]
VRDRFGDLLDWVKVPKLYGVNAIEAVLVLCVSQSRWYPPARIPDSDDCTVDTALERWDTNITQPVGYAKFMAIVSEMKQMVEALNLP